MTNATERETLSCMCFLCLNTRLLFDTLMKHSKKHNGPTYESISTFLMGNCPCNKVDNGYWVTQMYKWQM